MTRSLPLGAYIVGEKQTTEIHFCVFHINEMFHIKRNERGRQTEKNGGGKAISDSQSGKTSWKGNFYLTRKNQAVLGGHKGLDYLGHMEEAGGAGAGRSHLPLIQAVSSSSETTPDTSLRDLQGSASHDCYRH